jgi:hypothetical protein
MAHGYLREFDEGPDRDRDREDWRERDWRATGREDRDFFFGDRDREPDRDDDRGFFSRMRDDSRSMFGDDDRHYRQSNRGWDQDRERSRSSFGEDRASRASSHPDDHYRSWRDRQMQSLDRDYADYCREREQQFHSDFDSWRANRQRQGLRVGTPLEQGTGPDEQTFTPETTAVGNTMTTSETHEPQSTTTPEDTATLGTARRR